MVSASDDSADNAARWRGKLVRGNKYMCPLEGSVVGFNCNWDKNSALSAPLVLPDRLDWQAHTSGRYQPLTLNPKP